MLEIFSTKYIVLTVAVFSVFYVCNARINKLQQEKNVLEKEFADKKTELAYSKLKNERVEKALKEQNKEVELLKLNEKLSLAKLKKFKLQSPDVKYRFITKYRKVKSNDCKDIKNTIDAVKHIDFTGL